MPPSRSCREANDPGTLPKLVYKSRCVNLIFGYAAAKQERLGFFLLPLPGLAAWEPTLPRACALGYVLSRLRRCAGVEKFH